MKLFDFASITKLLYDYWYIDSRFNATFHMVNFTASVCELVAKIELHLMSFYMTTGYRFLLFAAFMHL